MGGRAMKQRNWRTFRLTIRARITLSVALLIALGGGVIVAGLNVFMRFGPVWALPVGEAFESSDSAILNSAQAAPDLSIEMFGESELGVDGLQLAVPVLEIRDATDVFDTLLWSSIVALILIVVLGGLAAWVLAGRLLAPLHEINEAARSATPNRLDRRVALRGPRDELTDLSDTLDEMLERLERAFQAQQLFAANASHELRTPLATEKAMIDMLLDGPEPSAAEYRTVVERLREVNGRSIAMGEALLELTRSQMGVGSLAREEYALHEATEVLAEPLARAREAAAARGLRITVDVEDHALAANPELLGRLLDNVLGNATRHAVPGGANDTGDGAVHLSWVTDEEESVLRIQNTGARLDNAVRQRLHEPFVRGGGRVRADAGSGLGLAIAAAVAQAHGGTLSVLDPDTTGSESDATEDFIVEVRLPLQSALDTLAQ